MIIAEYLCADESIATPDSNPVRFPQSDEDLFPSEDKRSIRAMNRMTILILHCLEKQMSEFQKIQNKRLGIYAVIDIGPTPDKVLDILMTEGEKNFEAFRSAWPPKHLFKKDGGVISAQISIYLKTNGPAISFNNSDAAFKQALATAQCDLETGHVDYALIAGAFSPEDATLLYKASMKSEVVSEAVGFVLFDRESSKFPVPTEYDNRYSHCSQMIATIKDLKKMDQGK